MSYKCSNTGNILEWCVFLKNVKKKTAEKYILTIQQLKFTKLLKGVCWGGGRDFSRVFYRHERHMYSKFERKRNDDTAINILLNDRRNEINAE